MIRKKMMFWFLVWLIFFCFFPLEARGIVVSWDANTEPDLAGYNIYLATTYENASQGISDIASFSVTKPCFCYNIDPNINVVFVAITAYDTEGMESEFTIGYVLRGNIWGTYNDGVAYTAAGVNGQDLGTLGLYFNSATSHQEIDCSGTFVVENPSLDQRSDLYRDNFINGRDLIELGLRYNNTAS